MESSILLVAQQDMRAWTPFLQSRTLEQIPAAAILHRARLIGVGLDSKMVRPLRKSLVERVTVGPIMPA
ncbi:MAG: hypothetical protein DMG57_01740 [Acidobacteria bacterium]|nr:MAG: hypothetical protein DMG57_01740 [Acidobacteriota bacterium]